MSSSKFEVGKTYYDSSRPEMAADPEYMFTCTKVDRESEKIQFKTVDCFGNPYRLTVALISGKDHESAVTKGADCLIRSSGEVE